MKGSIKLTLILGKSADGPESCCLLITEANDQQPPMSAYIINRKCVPFRFPDWFGWLQRKAKFRTGLTFIMKTGTIQTTALETCFVYIPLTIQRNTPTDNRNRKKKFPFERDEQC